MDFSFKNKKISGIISIMPKNTAKFMDEVENYGFSMEKSMGLKKMIGLNERRIATNETCASDLCIAGIEYLLKNNLLKKEEISAIIMVSQTPDHFMPPTSSVIHGKLELQEDTLCLDITHGCAGYIYGLLVSFMVLDAIKNGKVLLLNGDTLSRATYYKDRSNYPLIGDAGSVTILENYSNNEEIYVSLKTDGKRREWLTIPAGAFRVPSSEQTREVKTFPDGNQRSDEHFTMNGTGVFKFSQTDVVDLINDYMKIHNISKDDIDYYILHQPNKFLLTKIAQKLNISLEKIPMNIVEKYGNSSSATIPMTICHNFKMQDFKESKNILFSGFGVGLSWGCLKMKLGQIDICECIEI